VRHLRANRSESEWRASLDAVERAARGGDNLVPTIIAAVEKRATLGEVASSLRRVFGEYRETSA
jgi:methylmalonyl-CoA mutase N-terminal domain/subunit